MPQKNFDHVISERMNRHFDLSMPFFAMISWISAVTVWLSDIPNKFAWMDVIVGILLMGIYWMRNRLKPQHKIMAVTSAAIGLSVLFFMDGGFSSGAFTLMLIGNGIAVLLLSKRMSLIIAITTMMSVSLLWVWAKWTGFTKPMEMNDGVWAIQLILMFLYLFIYRKSAFSMRSYLLENIKELEVAVTRSNDLAYFDQLTHLPNQIKFKQWLEENQLNQPCNGFVVLVAFMNLKIINAVYGIVRGDEVLCRIAECLRKACGELEYLGRTSGNEFALWIPVMGMEQLKSRLEDYKESINQCFDEKTMKNQLDYHIAYAYMDPILDTTEQCFHKASLAMTYAKFWKIKGLISYDQDLEDILKRETTLKNQIRADILEQRGFRVLYQPKYNAMKEEVIGVEALSRWCTEAYGEISPMEFIRLIEDIRMHTEFGLMILDKVLSDYTKLCVVYNKEIHVSINISPSFLMTTGFAEQIIEKVRAKGVPFNRVVLEVTEEVMIEGKGHINRVLGELRKLGFIISLDDFGTGYSALNYLADMEVDELKIDKSLVSSILTNSKSYVLLATLIQLAEAFQLDLVAEGVETKEQLEAVVSMGCPVIQGYFYGRPEPLELLDHKKIVGKITTEEVVGY